MRILVLIHISNYSDDRLTGKAKVEGDLVGNSQIALKQTSCAYRGGDSQE